MPSVALLLPLLFALLGAAFGSFGNVLIYRINHGKRVLGRSACPHCQYGICWYDLVPVVSYVRLRGRCRQCTKRISPLYPAIELTTVILFVIAASLSPFDPLLAAALSAVLYGLLLVCVFDFKYQQIPDLFTGIVALGALATLLRTGGWSDALKGALLVFLWFGIQWAVSNGRFVGSGDIFLGAALGLWLKLTLSIEMLFLSYIIGAAAALYLLFTGKAKLKDSQLPFGPFLACSALIVYVAKTNNVVLITATLMLVAVGLGTGMLLINKNHKP